MGKSRAEKWKKERLGLENYNNQGYLMKIIEYNHAKDMVIEFQDEYKTRIKTYYREFVKGTIKNPYHRTVENVGYTGVGKYSMKTHKEIYLKWCDMIKRCYNPYELNKHPTYIDCYVEEDLHNFQNFAEWYEKESYYCKGEGLDLDKDILYKGNKVYSKDTMILAPHRINSLFIKCDSNRGEYPIGVNYYPNYNCLAVRCQTLNKREFLGYFPLDKPFQAFYTYKIFKEDYIKQVADEYKDLIPKKLYEALYRYEVEIND